MAGIYIHIPFCRKACHYCDFHFSTGLGAMEDMGLAICKELYQRKNFLANTPVSTIYFGGGTPSLLPKSILHSILDTVNNHFLVEKNVEISFEANPDDITKERLIEWMDTGINRLSIGIQSFQEADLAWMNRAHTADQSFQSINWVNEVGFTNYSIDLIYGSPALTDSGWEENLAFVVQHNIKHLSAYALTVEPRTALAKQIQQQKIANVDPDKQAKHFAMLSAWANNHNYSHYEISNLAKEGYRSNHNANYWKGLPYLGVGPSAHSFDGKNRGWNISNNALYIRAQKNNLNIYEEEKLTDTQRANEYIMTSIRTIEGLDLTHIQDLLGEAAVSMILRSANKAIHNGLLQKEHNILTLTQAGKFLADGIAADLFL
ncbi:MAG: radical SAM family heme chaperone HemW [Chitinophagaceae bacterium]|nr:radical SAM family heme chaperone HemW [Chitinophagaceae bacterium]